MSRTTRLVLLAALCAGAFLVGAEVFITAVALPRIVPDLGDWTELRRASWIVNGYLVAYIAAMPLAGRAADRYGLPRLVMLALGVFAMGSVLSGASQSLDQLIAARVLQGLGAGAVLPLATAGASHLYRGHARARALGIVGGATFLGMAFGPLFGALALEALELGQALRGAGLGHAPWPDLLTPAWRWIFYGTAPLAILALLYVWAAAPEWDIPPPTSGHLDAAGGALFTLALTSALVGLTLIGEEGTGGTLVPAAAGLVALVSGLLAWRHLRREADPFLDLALFRDRRFSSAVVVSVLTGYGLATAIIGSAVFVDRVRYAGPGEQLVTLGSLALAMALGSLAAGFLLRVIAAVPLTLIGLAASVAGLLLLAASGPGTDLAVLVGGLALFGAGFGLTVTPRSSVAVESAGRRAYGMASAAVTMARMVGMAVGLAILTAFGTTRIDALSRLLTDAYARDQVLPETLRGRPLDDPLVIAVLEGWAASQAAEVLAGLFVVAALVTLAAAVPAIAMRGAHTAEESEADIDEPREGAPGAYAPF